MVPMTTAVRAPTLLVTSAKLIATCDAGRRELPGGWVAISRAGEWWCRAPSPRRRGRPGRGGTVWSRRAPSTPTTTCTRTSPGRMPPSPGGTLFEWLISLYPLWAGLDEEAVYSRPWVGWLMLASAAAPPAADHLYVLPRARGDRGVEIARPQVGPRFHPTRESMTLSVTDDGLPPDSVVQDDDEALADSERLVRTLMTSVGRDGAGGARPVSPFSVSP